MRGCRVICWCFHRIYFFLICTLFSVKISFGPGIHTVLRCTVTLYVHKTILKSGEKVFEISFREFKLTFLEEKLRNFKKHTILSIFQL